MAKLALVFGTILLGNVAITVVMDVLGANVGLRAVALCLGAVAGGTVIAYFSDQLPDLSRFGGHGDSSRSRH